VSPLCRSLPAAALLLWAAGAVRSQDAASADRPLADRVGELEVALKRLDEPKAPLAGWENGFYLRSPDQDFQLRLTGQVQADYRGYLNEADTTDLPTFLVRRARLGVEATLLRYYEFRLLPDFGRGESRLQDAYFNLRYWDEFQFEVGKFKQPFSLEFLIQDRFVPFVERSILDQLGPARDVGVMVHGQKLLGDRLDYGVSVYGGVRDGDGDNDRNKEGAARLTVRPFRGDGMPDWLGGLQLGGAGTFGQDAGAIVTPLLRTPANVPWFAFNTDARPDGTRWRVSPELAYLYGPVLIAAQYYRESRGYRLGDADLTQTAEGYYVFATLLLTGEERTAISQAVTPLREFNPKDGGYGPGAVELVGRVSRVSLTLPAQLYDPDRSAPAATETTLGFNWYLNRWVRFQFNWEYAHFSRPVRLGERPTDRLNHQNSFVSRFQIIF
jgi:phosphate-selective porin OprO/OprP